MGARESDRLRNLETSYQQQMQIAAAEWRAAEELKIEAEVERRTQDRIQEQLNIQQLQLLSVQPSRVGEPNVIQHVQMNPPRSMRFHLTTSIGLGSSTVTTSFRMSEFFHGF